MSWQEYGSILDGLYEDVSAYVSKRKIKIDAVVAILRGGGIPATYFAYRLGLLRVLPLQYKYFFFGRNIVLKKLLGFPKSKVGKERPTLLLVENNQDFGGIARTAAKELRRMFPRARIIYVSTFVDYSYRNAVKDVIARFYGEYTNETRGLTLKQCKKLGIDNALRFYPWESADEEWTTVEGKQYKYADLEDAMRNSKTILTIKN